MLHRKQVAACPRRRRCNRQGIRCTRRMIVETLEKRLVLSVTAIGDPFVHADPLFGIDQSHVRVAASPESSQDSFVTVFEAADRDGDGLGVFAQIHSAANVDTIQVNTTTAGNQSHPDVAIFGDGAFVVTWQGPGIDAADGLDVYYRRFDASGNELTPETRVNTTTAGDQLNPVVDSNARQNRQFVIAWNGPGTDGQEVFAQFYDTGDSGVVLAGTEQQVNTTVVGDQMNPDIAMDDNFNPRSIVVWEGNDASGMGILSQRFDSQNVPLDGEVVVNPFAVLGDQRDPRVTIDRVVAISFIGPYDGVTATDALYGAVAANIDGRATFNDFLISQGGLNPIGGHDVAIVDQIENLQFAFGWTNGNQITLTQYEGLNFTTGASVPTFASRQIVPIEVDVVAGLSDSVITSADMSLASTLGSSGTFFTDGLLLVTNPIATTTGNDPARQSVLWDFDVSPERLILNVDTGFPTRVKVFDDINGDGIQDEGEDPIEDFTFFIDSNGNGIQDPLLPLEDFIRVTDPRGEAVVYYTDGMIPMSPLLASGERLTSGTSGGLVLSYATPLGMGEAIQDVGTFNPTVEILKDAVQFVGQSGEVESRRLFVISLGELRPVDLTGYTFIREREGVFEFHNATGQSFHFFPTTINGTHRNEREDVLLEIELDDGVSSRRRFGVDREVGFDPADNKVKVYSQGNKFGLGIFLTLIVEYDNAPMVGANEELRQLIVADFTRDSVLDIALLVRTEAGGFELRFYDNTGQQGWSEGRTIEIEPGVDINNVRVQLGTIDPENRMTDLIVFVDSQIDGGSQSDFFTLQNPGDGVFEAPVFAASGNSCDRDPFFAVTDMNGDGNDDLVCSADGTLRVSEGRTSPIGYFFSLFTTFQILESTFIAGLVARSGGKVAIGTDTHFLQLQSSLAMTFTAVAGLARQTPTPPPVQGKVEIADATGLIRVIVTATHENGDQLTTQTHDEDSNGDGMLDASELNLYSFTPTVPGLYNITVDADNSVAATHTVTVSPAAIVIDTSQCTDQSPCENLDFAVIDASSDFGDAPDSYGTAEHLIDGPILGITVDGELAGIGSPSADSDDRIGRDDEDGVVFGAELVPGQPASATVYASQFSGLTAFIDFNADGDFSDLGEALGGQSLEPGENIIVFDVPPNAVAGQTYARFRVFDDDEDNFPGPTGGATTGEVEDLVVTIANTTDEPRFGTLGVTSNASLVRSADTATTSSVSVDVIGVGKLYGWIDLNGDGDWLDAGEQIVNGAAVEAGSNFLSFPISPGTTSGDIETRFIVADADDVQPSDAGTIGDFLDLFFPVLSGVDTPDVSVNTVDGSTFVEQGSIVVRSDAIELFRAEVIDIGSLNVVGTAIDETVTIDLATGFTIPSGGLSVDGAGGTDSLVLIGDKGILDLTNPLISVTNVGHLDLSSTDVNTVALDAATVADLSPTARLVSIVTGEDDVINVRDASDWRMTEPIRNGSFIVTADNSVSGGSEAIQAENPHPWQNFLRASDVNNSGTITALDALRIINELNRREFSSANTSALNDPSSLDIWPGVYFDHNGDDLVTAADAARVINSLPLQGNLIAASGEEAVIVTSPTGMIRSAKLQDDEISEPDVERRLTNGPHLKLASFEFIVSQVTEYPATDSDPPPTKISRESLDRLMSVDSFIDQLTNQSLLHSMELAN